MSGLPSECGTLSRRRRPSWISPCASQPLATRQLLDALPNGPATTAFDQLAGELDALTSALELARQKNKLWHEPLSPNNTQSALEQARAFEQSCFRFLQPAFWRLKKTLQARYDFSQNAVAPAWTKILKDLAAQHAAQAALYAHLGKLRQLWQGGDVPAIRALVSELRADRRLDIPRSRPCSRN